MRFLALLFLILPFCLLASPKKRKHPKIQLEADDCTSGRTQALRDFKGDTLKYYYYGIVSASKETIQKAAKLNVRAISKGCVVTDAIKCYNEVADSLVYTTKKVHLSSLR